MGFRFSPAFANMYYTRINTGDSSHRSFCAHVGFAQHYEELLSEISFQITRRAVGPTRHVQSFALGTWSASVKNLIGKPPYYTWPDASFRPGELNTPVVL